jgi:hypothetical protein
MSVRLQSIMPIDSYAYHGPCRAFDGRQEDDQVYLTDMRKDPTTLRGNGPPAHLACW